MGADNHVFGQANMPDGTATLLIRPQHVLPVPAAQGEWMIERMTTSGAQAHLYLTRGAMSLDASITADALLEAGLENNAKVNVRIIGGTLFANHVPGPVRLHQKLPVVI